LYPFYDIATALRGAIERLGALAPGLPRMICLTERSDCHFFRDVLGKKILPPSFSVFATGENAFAVINNSGEKVFVIAGRQIATMEKLEVHCLGRDAAFPDGLPLGEAVEQVRSAGGIPVIPWGVGKWLGSRGKLIGALLNQSSDCLAGDSSLRPWCWPENIFRAADRRMIFGTDPLPAPGEENQIARYATVFDSPFDENDPAASLLAALRAGTFRSAGARCGALEVWRRLRAMKKAAR
jgi:hypothetical protein